MATPKREPRKVNYRIIILLVLAILALVVLFVWHICKQDQLTVLTVSLAIEVLGFSVFAQIYSNLIQSANTADANMHAYGLLSDIALKDSKEQATYKKIAQGWLTASKKFRGGAKLRAYSANSCLWSLLFLGITLVIFFFVAGWYWLISFTVSFIFLGLAFLIYIFYLDYKWFKFLGWKGIAPNLPRWNYVIKFIKEHPWLDADSDTAEIKNISTKE